MDKKTAILHLLFSMCVIISCTRDNIIHNTRSVPAEIVVDKIRGGLLGQILGNLNGIPYEGIFIDEPGNVTDYVPSLPDGARTDDDTDFEWFYICEMQKARNAYLPADTISKLWRERVNRGVYCSNRFARYLMDLGFTPPYTGYSTFNPWAGFNISGQFLCETFGLLAPGMPQTAGKIGLNYTTVAINNEPAQVTQLFTAMIATAFLEDDIQKILDAGMAVLDPNSDILQVVSDVRSWHSQYPDNWRETRRMLKEKYTQEEGSTRDWNGYELNTGSVIGSLLYGNGDFENTLQLAFNFGWDADNTAATAGTIAGVICGYRKMLNHNNKNQLQWNIVDRYINTTRDNMTNDETITSFADRILELFEMINEENGGRKTLLDNLAVYQIPVEQPVSVMGVISPEEQKEVLVKEFGTQIRNDLLKGNRDERARAAYMAVCLDMNTSLAESHPVQWKAACTDLSGYWKVMHNIYDGNFKSIQMFQKKFDMAGFKAPAKRYGDTDLYTSKDYWKDPDELY